jgi:hypothetical protein
VKFGYIRQQSAGKTIPKCEFYSVRRNMPVENGGKCFIRAFLRFLGIMGNFLGGQSIKFQKKWFFSDYC